MSSYYAIDVGGTSIKIGIVSEHGEILIKRSLKTDRSLSFEAFTESIRSALLGMRTESGQEPVGIGIGVPGYPDPVTGRLIDGSGNVPVIREASLREALSKQLDLPAIIDNDGVCAAIGELHFGIGKEVDSFVLLTLGTGIGGAVVLNRDVMVGAKREPPEFGAIVLDRYNGDVRKGIRGSFEDLAGAKSMIRSYATASGEAVESLNMNLIRERALVGESLAVETYSTMADHVAHAIGNIVNMTSIEHCVLGGGVSNAGVFLTDLISNRLPSYTWPLLNANLQLHVAKTGNDAGLIGAMSVFRLMTELRSEEPRLNGSLINGDSQTQRA